MRARDTFCAVSRAHGHGLRNLRCSELTAALFLVDQRGRRVCRLLSVEFRRLQHSRVDADYCCSADSGASGMTAARGGGATLWLSAPPHRVAQLARAGFRIAVRMQRYYTAR
jgi:hypothetical protein